VISKVFHDPVPDAPLAGPVMLLEGLQARIAGQLSMTLRQTQADCRHGCYGPVLAQPRHWAAYGLVGAR